MLQSDIVQSLLSYINIISRRCTLGAMLPPDSADASDGLLAQVLLMYGAPRNSFNPQLERNTDETARLVDIQAPPERFVNPVTVYSSLKRNCEP